MNKKVLIALLLGLGITGGVIFSNPLVLEEDSSEFKEWAEEFEGQAAAKSFDLKDEEDFITDEQDIVQSEHSLVPEDEMLNDALALRDKVSDDRLIVLSHEQQKPFVVSQDVELDAYNQYKSLNESALFFPDLLKRTKLIRKFLYSKYHFDGKSAQVKTDDKETIHYTYFDRGSDKLLLVGGGLNTQEKVAMFMKMFDDYDVILYNPRGLEYQTSTIWNPLTWRYWLSSHYIFDGMNGRKMTLGFKEEKDVFAVLDAAQQKKKYKQVYGIALCYSAPIFIKAAAMRPRLFTKLILDGSWVSVKRMVQQYAETLWEKDDEYWVHKVFPTKRKWFIKFFLWTMERVSGLKFRSLYFDFSPYVRKLDIPVLFVHSINDLVAPTEEFKQIWAQVPSKEKIVLLSTCEHVRNHLKRKEFYKYMSKAFFELPHNEFLTALQGPEILTIGK